MCAVGTAPIARCPNSIALAFRENGTTMVSVVLAPNRKAFTAHRLGAKETRMDIERPDLSQLEPAVRAYIESLETKLDRLRGGSNHSEETDAEALEPSEPPTPFNVITLSRAGIAKRTPRHLYDRQRRG